MNSFGHFEIGGVFPTGVGMNRTQEGKMKRVASVPHRRGDEPNQLIGLITADGCSPQAWG